MRDLSRAGLASCLFFLTGSLVASFVFATEKIDINTAPLEELVKIIHIGEVRALELISLRPFSSLDDLARIKGLGEKRIEDIKKQGLAWVDTLKEPEPKLLAQEGPKPIIYPSAVVINEILPSPTGPDETEEWVEIFNQNNFEVDLSNWQITDALGKTTIFTFPTGTKIAPNGFLVFSRPTTKITLNNDGDGLNLIHPDGKIIDSVTYEKAPRAQSYNRIDSNWAWSNVLTPGSTNIIPKSVVETKETTTLEKEIEEAAPKEERKEGIKPEQELAAIGKQIPEEKSNFFSILPIALALAIFSGIIILTIKKQINKCIIK